MCESLISVIIAVYNGANYIDRCVTSLIKQTIFENLQIIIVDDGSTDSSLEILKKYEEKYENIDVVHIQNQGVSNARNVGMQYVKGSYITFVDIDDWVEDTCYEKMYSRARRENADIVAAGMYISDDNKDIVERKVAKGEEVITGETGVFDFLTEKIDVHCCSKLFKAETMKQIGFEVNLKIAEDRLFVYQCFLAAKVIVLMDESFYHYYQNPASVMNQKFSEKNIDSLYAAEKISSLTQLMFPQFKKYAEAMYMSTACRVYCEMIGNSLYKETDICRELQNLIKNYKMVEAHKYMSRKHTIVLLLAKINPKAFNFLRRNSYLKFMK